MLLPPVPSFGAHALVEGPAPPPAPMYTTSDLLRLLAADGRSFAAVAEAVGTRFGGGADSQAWLACTLSTLLRDGLLYTEAEKLNAAYLLAFATPGGGPAARDALLRLALPDGGEPPTVRAWAAALLGASNSGPAGSPGGSTAASPSWRGSGSVPHQAAALALLHQRTPAQVLAEAAAPPPLDPQPQFCQLPLGPAPTALPWQGAAASPPAHSPVAHATAALASPMAHPAVPPWLQTPSSPLLQPMSPQLQPAPVSPLQQPLSPLGASPLQQPLSPTYQLPPPHQPPPSFASGNQAAAAAAAATAAAAASAAQQREHERQELVALHELLQQAARAPLVPSLQQRLASALRGPLAAPLATALAAAVNGGGSPSSPTALALQPHHMRGLVEHNSGVAAEVLLALLARCSDAAALYAAAVAELPMSAQNVECLSAVVAGGGELPGWVLATFLANCMADISGCGDAGRQSRHVRLLCACVTLVAARQPGALAESLPELLSFCIQQSRHKPAADLYRQLRDLEG